MKKPEDVATNLVASVLFAGIGGVVVHIILHFAVGIVITFFGCKFYGGCAGGVLDWMWGHTYPLVTIILFLLSFFGWNIDPKSTSKTRQ